MNPSTGHLVADLTLLTEAERKQYIPIPEPFLDHARAALAGQPETVVNLKQQSELAQWAKAEKAKRRARNKAAKRSRARNR